MSSTEPMPGYVLRSKERGLGLRVLVIASDVETQPKYVKAGI